MTFLNKTSNLIILVLWLTLLNNQNILILKETFKTFYILNYF